MTDWIDIKKDKLHVARERIKANELKKSNWWKNQLAKGICHYCSEKFSSQDLTMDHLVPVSRGGKSNKGNVVVSCLDCNQKKKHLTPVEMLLNQIDKGK
jgi:5-methylcytosine-specific restriction endonuclease McrA